jgi:alpha-D-ribose 1-methylphosphonate 5-triphosphate synthase subunit PhnH
MSIPLAQLKESRFDFINDSQKVFKTLMMSMAFPGEIRALDKISLCLPIREHRFIMQPLLTLLDLETSFHVHCKNTEIRAEVRSYLEISTNSLCVDLTEADFVLCLEPSLNGHFEQLKRGSLEMPHTGATVFYLADRILPSQSPLSGGGGVQLSLSGPGIKARNGVHLYGIMSEEAEVWRFNRGTFPLGIDLYIISRQGEIIGIPRSVTVRE